MKAKDLKNGLRKVSELSKSTSIDFKEVFPRLQEIAYRTGRTVADVAETFSQMRNFDKVEEYLLKRNSLGR